MEFFKEILGKIWYILYPFLFYYAVMLIIMTIAQWAFGGGRKYLADVRKELLAFAQK